MTGFARFLAAALVALAVMATPLAAPTPAQAADKIDICGLVSAADLAQVYRKPLFAKPAGNGCMWSKDEGGMAYLHIGVHEYHQPLRKYFNEKLADTTKLEKITDLGDEGLMTVGEGSLGVVVVKKGNMVLQSAATFLDIAPGSKQQKALWEIYRRVLEKL